MNPSRPQLVCDLDALTGGQRTRLESLSVDLFARAEALEILPDGYDLAYPRPTPDTFTDLAELIAYDHVCCPFLQHTITIDSGDDVAHLRLRGPDGAKEAITPGLAGLVRPDVAQAAGLTSS